MSNSTETFKPNFEGLVSRRKDKALGDGYEPGEHPFADDAYDEPSDTKSYQSSRSRATRDMDRDRYEPSAYGRDRTDAARDGWARDARSDAYERSQYGGGEDRYAVTRTSYGGQSGYDRRRSYDDHDVDNGYYERTRVTNYVRDGGERGERGLAPYDDRDRQRARSQDYRQQDYREDRTKPRGRRDSDSGSDDEHGDNNTPLKKWAATFAGAAVGGIAANRFQKDKEGNWVPTAIGAVVGGLLGREVEKKVYEHKEKRREHEHERY